MTTNHDPRADALRQWARGDLALEAASELLITALTGRLLGGPWIHRSDDHGFWFDPELAAAEGGVLSGGERRVLHIAMSLASSDHPVDLSDAITGIDGDALGHVLAALAHTGGHQAQPLPLTRSVDERDLPHEKAETAGDAEAVTDASDDQ